MQKLRALHLIKNTGMDRPLFLMVAACSLFCLCRLHSTSSRGRDPYYDHAREFLQFARDSLLRGERLLVDDRPVKAALVDCEEEVLKDTALFSAEEIRQLRTDFQNPKITVWDSTLLHPAVFIPRDSIDSIFSGRHGNDTVVSGKPRPMPVHDAWQVFYHRYGGGYTGLSAPIFLRDYTYCLFYSANSCGWLCGSGNWSLYRKENGRWKWVRSWCQWIS